MMTFTVPKIFSGYPPFLQPYTYNTPSGLRVAIPEAVRQLQVAARVRFGVDLEDQ